ncbi:MAG: hypothetical protein KME45_23820 [Stenomitos rutilans HA7619-LM2]|jgi:hypothetical protein|nr:hypothetical protein [Stenomitos rutilans HA7619-LM2]
MMKQKPPFRFDRFIHLYIGGFVLLMFGWTYGKWKFLSTLYASEFYPAIKQASDHGCLIGYAKTIKVIDYSQNAAVIWFKDKSGNTWFGKPWRSLKYPNWQFVKISSEKIEGSSGKYCDVEIINSQTGGSADGHFWYN